MALVFSCSSFLLVPHLGTLEIAAFPGQSFIFVGWKVRPQILGSGIILKTLPTFYLQLTFCILMDYLIYIEYNKYGTAYCVL